MAGSGRLEELELSAEEAERLQRAFRDKRFRELFAEYAAELSDPEQQRLYEQEVTALERERGVEVRFLHPTPGYVLRTSQAGSRRCYLNVCSNPHVAPPQARPEPGGLRWELPHCLAPGREQLGRAGRRFLLYDIAFHPAALRMAARSARFRRLLSDTAMEAVQSRFAVQLDRANAAVLRGTKYMGVPQAPVLRTPLPGCPSPDPDSPLPPFPMPPPPTSSPPPPAAPAAPSPPPGPTTPRWSLRHRSYVDLQDYRCSRDSAPGPVPRELVVTVELPLLRSAARAALEVLPRELRLDSQRPAYRLRLRLPYDVDESRGRAVFDKAKRQLLVTLPVVPPPGPGEPPGESGGERSEEPEPPAGSPPEPAAEPEAEAGTWCREEAAEPPSEPEAEPTEPPATPSLPPLSEASSPITSLEPLPPSGDPSSIGDPSPAHPPHDMAHPQGEGDNSPAAALCPPFRCRQDEASLTLLLLVPHIQPHSLSTELGTNHYHLHFSSGTATYALFLQFPPANRLAAPESNVSISAHNAAITLAKAPRSAGLWERFCFGPDASALQERLFVSEENVDGFLDTVLCPSLSTQSEVETETLIEVLDVSEDLSRIQLKPQEAAQSEHDETEHVESSSGGDLAEKSNGANLQTKAETDCAAAAHECGTKISGTSTSSVTAETMGKEDGGSQHCLQREPSDAASALPGKSGRKEQDFDGAFTAGSEQPEGLGRRAGGEAAVGLGSRAASPVLQEVGTDGSVQSTRDHITRCAVAFQNSLLYELD